MRQAADHANVEKMFMRQSIMYNNLFSFKCHIKCALIENNIDFIPQENLIHLQQGVSEIIFFYAQDIKQQHVCQLSLYQNAKDGQCIWERNS